MTAIINVDKQKRDDPHYRYKMPTIECKVESGGNGVKVVFSNLADVAFAIHRPPEALLKHLGVSRGAQATYDAKDNKFYIMGNHLPDEIQNCVFDFIEKFVLCRHCRNPETQVIPGRSVKLRCGACGKDSSIDSLDERVVKELVRGSSQTKSETVKADTSAPTPAPTINEADVVTVLDLTQDYTLPGESTTTKDPTSALAEALKDLKTLGKIGVQKRLISIKSEHGVSDEDIPRLVFRSATDATFEANGPFIAQLREAVFLFKNQIENCKSAADKVSVIQDTILSEICLRVINRDKPEKVPMVLKMLIDETVLDPIKVITFIKNIQNNGQIKKKGHLPLLVEQLAVLCQWLEDGTAQVAVEGEDASKAAPAGEAPAAAAAKTAKKKKVVADE